MRRHVITILAIGVFACGGSQSGDTTPATGAAGAGASSGTAANSSTNEHGRARAPNEAGEFKVKQADKSSRPTQGRLKATPTKAAVRFFVVDKNKGPIKGVVISLTSPAGEKYYTGETADDGFAEVLVPIGQTYDLVYLSLGRRGVAAKVKVANKPNLNLKLTLRYQREEYPEGLVLEDVQFETGKARLIGTSAAHLDAVVEYMTHKKSVHIEISGHTDNVGNKKANKRLSQRRADAVRAYLISRGIDASRMRAVGYGDQKPIAPNDTAEGRQKNRRIEVTEL